MIPGSAEAGVCGVIGVEGPYIPSGAGVPCMWESPIVPPESLFTAGDMSACWNSKKNM